MYGWMGAEKSLRSLPETVSHLSVQGGDASAVVLDALLVFLRVHTSTGRPAGSILTIPGRCISNHASAVYELSIHPKMCIRTTIVATIIIVPESRLWYQGTRGSCGLSRHDRPTHASHQSNLSRSKIK